MIKNIISVAVLIILIMCVGFFTSSETAYLSLPKLKLRSMLEKKRPNAKLVARLKRNMDRLLTTVLIGTNFLNSLASALATAFAKGNRCPNGMIRPCQVDTGNIQSNSTAPCPVGQGAFAIQRMNGA